MRSSLPRATRSVRRYVLTAVTAALAITASVVATFCARAVLAGGGSTSFESYAHPGRYLRHHDFERRVDWRTPDAAFASDASFTVSTLLA